MNVSKSKVSKRELAQETFYIVGCWLLRVKFVFHTKIFRENLEYMWEYVLSAGCTFLMNKCNTTLISSNQWHMKNGMFMFLDTISLHVKLPSVNRVDFVTIS